MPDHHTSRALPYFFPRFPVDVDHNMTSLKAAELWCWRPFHVGLGGGEACSVVIEHIKHIPEPSMPLYTANLMDYHVYINIHNVYIYIYSHNIHVCIIYICTHYICVLCIYIYIYIPILFIFRHLRPTSRWTPAVRRWKWRPRPCGRSSNVCVRRRHTEG